MLQRARALHRAAPGALTRNFSGARGRGRYPGAMAGTAVEPATFVEQCVSHARELVRGRPVVLAGLQLAASTRRVRTLRELGAERCFVVASGVGTGPLPEADDAESIVVPIEAADMMSEMRATEALLADP